MMLCFRVTGTGTPAAASPWPTQSLSQRPRLIPEVRQISQKLVSIKT